jgi:hypothetical protein
MDKKRWITHPDWIEKGHMEGKIVPGRTAPKHDFKDLQVIVDNLVEQARERNLLLIEVKKQIAIYETHVKMLEVKIKSCNDYPILNGYESEKQAYQTMIHSLKVAIKEFDEE